MFLIEAATLLAAATAAWQLRGVVTPAVRAAVGYGAYTNALSNAGQVAVVVGLWLVVLIAMRAYSSQNFAVGYGEFQLIATASGLSLGVTGFAAYVVQMNLSRGFLLFVFLIGVPLLLLVRYLERSFLSHLRTRGKLRRRAIIVGSASAVDELHRVLRRESWTGYDVLGACLPETAADDASLDLPALGFVGNVRQVVTAENADTVIVAGGGYSSSQDLRRLAWGLEGLKVDMLVAPALTDVAGPRVRVRNVAGLPLVHIAEPSIDEARGFWKRAFDVAVASLGLLFISPLLLLIALAIKLDDGGPIFFRQERVGVLGHRFRMVKFRSMTTDAEAVMARLTEQNECDGTLFKMKRDPRITPVGRLLRKFSLDELPQLFNVFRGQMSLVGPRPALPVEVETYADHVSRRLLVPPGMTGLWQVSGRSDLSWEESVRLDLYYVDNWSMMNDLVIMLKTVKAVALSSGAY
jgi:exopolysaccharide biosynthesis polyprenyl glycosylphosphotransferase